MCALPVTAAPCAACSNLGYRYRWVPCDTCNGKGAHGNGTHSSWLVTTLSTGEQYTSGYKTRTNTKSICSRCAKSTKKGMLHNYYVCTDCDGLSVRDAVFQTLCGETAELIRSFLKDVCRDEKDRAKLVESLKLLASADKNDKRCWDLVVTMLTIKRNRKFAKH